MRFLPLSKITRLGGAQPNGKGVDRMRSPLDISPETPTARSFGWSWRTLCCKVRRRSPLERGCWWKWLWTMPDARVGQKYARRRPRHKGSLQQGILSRWVLLLIEERWVVCPHWELKWSSSLSFSLIYPMEGMDPGRTVGGAGVSLLTRGFKSPGPSGNILEEAKHVVCSPTFPMFSVWFKIAIRERGLVKSVPGLTMMMMMVIIIIVMMIIVIVIIVIMIIVIIVILIVIMMMMMTIIIITVSEALFYTGRDNPFQGPLGRPILGASNHCFI